MSTPRTRSLTRPRARRCAWLACASVLALVASLAGMPAAHAQGPSLNLGIGSQPRAGADAQMLVQADQLVYDNDNNRVSAEGHVEIYYEGHVLEADRVIYDRKTGRVQAEGNVRIRHPSGQVTYADSADVTQNFKEGFVKSLRVETPDKTRFAASDAEQVSETTTVFTRGVYTACEPCKDNPEKPPLWQVRAAKIIADRNEKMVYYRDASLEFYGQPIAYFPYLAHPEPTKKRQSGFLNPRIGHSDKLGYYASTPYYFALAPNYDLTLTPTVYSRQGPMLAAEWRHRLLDGSYAIRGAGIFQLDPEAFKNPNPVLDLGDRSERGYVNATARFDINQQWRWGLDGWLLSDRTFLRAYNLVPLGTPEVVSQLFLTGLGERNYFDIRALHFLSLSPYENQDVIPVVHPVMDYNYLWDRPILGGEFGFDANVTSLSRAATDAFRLQTGSGRYATYIRGLEGVNTRASVDTHWRRQIVDPLGQIFTPFASLRGDVFGVTTGSDSPLIPEAFRDEDRTILRGMATAGLEYRYPFISVHDWGTQVVEPIAQVIVRPNEAKIGELPNEDAQSLVFDDTSLFEWNKFSGYDRVEGGVRANAGLSYTATLVNGIKANVLFGESFHLAGRNSFATPDLLHTGLDSGLDKDRSDYVGRLYLQASQYFNVAARFRLDSETLDPQRLEVGAQGSYERVRATVTYARLGEQPEIGSPLEREMVSGTLAYKLTSNWTVQAGGNYDVHANSLLSSAAQLSYADECFTLSLNYSAQYYETANQEPTHTVMLRFNLRTLGGSGYSQSFGAGASPLQTPSFPQ